MPLGEEEETQNGTKFLKIPEFATHKATRRHVNVRVISEIARLQGTSVMMGIPIGTT